MIELKTKQWFIERVGVTLHQTKDVINSSTGEAIGRNTIRITMASVDHAVSHFEMQNKLSKNGIYINYRA